MTPPTPEPPTPEPSTPKLPTAGLSETELHSERQYTIVHSADRATVVEVGGGLRSYVADGRELLDGYVEDQMASSARGQPLVPWPNRLRDGQYTWDGQTHQAPLSEPDQGNAIHGFLRFANWTCLGQKTSLVHLGQVLHPRPGYPFTLAVPLSYRLGRDGLTVTTTARNVGSQAVPYAAGQHPYLAAPTGLVDDCVLQAPGARYLPADDRGIPTGRKSVHGSESTSGPAGRWERHGSTWPSRTWTATPTAGPGSGCKHRTGEAQRSGSTAATGILSCSPATASRSRNAGAAAWGSSR
jgi:aldose 1-epimerase